MEDTLIYYGDAVKALEGNRVGGWLVRFGSPEEPDQSRMRDYFTSETDFDVKSWPSESAVYYHHGLDPVMGRTRLGYASMKMMDDGVWVEADMDEWLNVQVKSREQWERAIGGMKALIDAGKLSWSSGTLPHLVVRDEVKTNAYTAHHVRHWPLGKDASLTPFPGEKRCQVIAVKSLTALLTLESLFDGLKATPPRRSLAEQTEQVIEDLESVLVGYRHVSQAEMKVGAKLSAARRGRLTEARDTINAILEETAIREEEADSPTADPAMGEGTRDPSGEVKRQADMLRLRTRTLLATTSLGR